MAEPSEEYAPALPLYFREFLIASEVGYASVRGPQRLTAREFNYWWAAFSRWQEVQSEEGRKRLRLSVQARALDDEEADGGRVTQEQRQAETQYAQVPDGTRVADTLYTQSAQLLALLPADDPRAIFLRAGGRLDAQGNPVGTTSRPPTHPPPLPPPPQAPLPVDPLRPPPEPTRRPGGFTRLAGSGIERAVPAPPPPDA